MEADKVTKAAWLERHPPPRVFLYEISEGFDPLSKFPREVFLEILFYLSFNEIMANVSLVSRAWNDVCQDTGLWKEYLYQLYIEMHPPPKPPKIEEITEEEQPNNNTSETFATISSAEKGEIVNKMEAEDEGLKKSIEAMKEYEHMNEWKRYQFALTCFFFVLFYFLVRFHFYSFLFLSFCSFFLIIY